MFRMLMSRIRLVEGLAASAWPAAEVQVLDGWRLRADEAGTRRANSVWPNNDSGAMPLCDKLASVKDFYAARDLPIYYQICPATQPSNLDEVLSANGYASEAPTDVQTANVAAVLEHTALRRSNEVTILDHFDEAWFAIFYQSEGVTESQAAARLALIRRIPARTGFALFAVDGKPTALAMGVHEQDWVGVFAMATRPEFRRRGAATAVLHSLARWAQALGAVSMYLQVMYENAAALALYARAGFETLYTYHYRKLSR
jgi:N-acetylglutamate synthase